MTLYLYLQGNFGPRDDDGYIPGPPPSSYGPPASRRNSRVISISYGSPKKASLLSTYRSSMHDHQSTIYGSPSENYASYAPAPSSMSAGGYTSSHSSSNSYTSSSFNKPNSISSILASFSSHSPVTVMFIRPEFMGL